MKKLFLLLASLALLTSCSSAGRKADGQETPVTATESATERNDGQETKKEDIIITWALNAPEPTDKEKKIVKAFNEADNGYKVVVKDLAADFFDEDEEHRAFTDMHINQLDFRAIQEIMNTDDIDIICNNSFGNPAKLELLARKGAFVDLYTLMDGDPDINRETLNSHILSLNETDGKLYKIPVRYMVNTLFGKPEYVGTKVNQTVDEFIANWENMPEGATLSGSNNSEYAYYTILRGNLESFVDYENLEVNFDCDEFRKLLEFCKRFEKKRGEKGEYFYDAPRLVYEGYIEGFIGANNFREGGMTAVGYPTEKGDGAFFVNAEGPFSISAKSSPEKQRGAWEFIKMFESTEYLMDTYIDRYEQTDPYTGERFTTYSPEFGFPVNNEAFELQMKEMTEGKNAATIHQFKDDDAYNEELEGKTVNVADAECCRKLVEYLDSIDRYEPLMDSALGEIVNEEILSYLNDEKNIDECINLIQNRASVWISEQG